MSKLTIVYHADRVGGSTYCQTYKDANWQYVHFARSDYSELLTTPASFVIADRGYLEQALFDKYYRGIHVNESDECERIQQFENALARKYDQIENIILYRVWDDVLLQRHIDELASGCEDFDNEIKQRKKLHHLYYEHMNRVRNFTGFTTTWISK